MASIDLNCDIGEELDEELDAALFALITSASIACGGHAGSPWSMSMSVERALVHSVAIGAHVSYPDRDGFGRRAIALDRASLAAVLTDQVMALRDIAERAGVRISYVKPHGALYHAAMQDLDVAGAVLEAADTLGAQTPLFGMAGTGLAHLAPERVIAEGFPERGYASATALQRRGEPGALVEDPSTVAQRAVAMARGDRIALVDGRFAVVEATTVCIHSDHPHALDNARAVRSALAEAGIDVQACTG